ncbi:hypothetical protein D3C81_2178960 [compost metagenome]
MLSGVLPSGSLSLASRLRVIGTPKLVPPVSATEIGAWFAPVSGAVPTTMTGSVSLPPAADLTVTVAGGWVRSATVRRCRVPVFDSRP